MELRQEKLDAFRKILIATGQINYLAANMSEVNSQMKLLCDEHGYHKEGIKARDEMLDSVVEKLSDIMEDMAELLNGQDAVCEIDIRVSSVPFEILRHGKDEVDTNYDEDQQSN